MSCCFCMFLGKMENANKNDLKEDFMKADFMIHNMHATEILDSRGNPTVQVSVIVRKPDGSFVQASASVPSGASTGQFEAVELRDAETRYFGLGTQKAVSHVNTKIRPALIGQNAMDQLMIDRIMLDMDGTVQAALKIIQEKLLIAR